MCIPGVPVKQSLTRSKKGFTLIELVIVIAVLAIIAAIAIPSVIGVVKNANSAADASNAQALEATLKVFAVQMESGQLQNGAENLKNTSRSIELFKKYGINEIPTVKSHKNGVFAWIYSTSADSVNGKVMIFKNTKEAYTAIGSHGGAILGDSTGKDQLFNIFPEFFQNKT